MQKGSKIGKRPDPEKPAPLNYLCHSATPPLRHSATLPLCHSATLPRLVLAVMIVSVPATLAPSQAGTLYSTMASGSTMAAVNVPDSRDNSLTPPPPEKGTTAKGTQCKTRQGATKILTPAILPTNKRIAYQALHDAPSGIVSDSQLQNKVANLKRQMLEAKKAALQKRLQTLTVANPGPTRGSLVAQLVEEARNLNFGLFYEHEGEESHLFPLMREYRSVDIQYKSGVGSHRPLLILQQKTADMALFKVIPLSTQDR